MDSLEIKLSEARWLQGDAYSEADKEAFINILKGEAPNVTTHPNTFAWYAVMCHYSWAKDIAKGDGNNAEASKKKSEPAK